MPTTITKNQAKVTLIEASNLSVTLNNKIILRDISLQAQSGQIITIIGPNGAGKSTLIKTLLGLQTQYSGLIRKKDNLRIGYIPQRLSINQLIPMQVKHFLQLCPAATLDTINVIANQLNITALISNNMADLSGGELQRVLLARALLNNPELLVLDEPNQGVDLNGQLEFYKLMRNIAHEQNCCILMVSHDLHFVMADTDHVICMNQHICCAGTPQYVTQDPNFINLFGAQAAEYLVPYSHMHHHNHNLDGSAQ